MEKRGSARFKNKIAPPKPEAPRADANGGKNRNNINEVLP